MNQVLVPVVSSSSSVFVLSSVQKKNLQSSICIIFRSFEKNNVVFKRGDCRSIFSKASYSSSTTTTIPTKLNLYHHYYQQQPQQLQQISTLLTKTTITTMMIMTRLRMMRRCVVFTTVLSNVITMVPWNFMKPISTTSSVVVAFLHPHMSLLLLSSSQQRPNFGLHSIVVPLLLQRDISTSSISLTQRRKTLTRSYIQQRYASSSSSLSLSYQPPDYTIDDDDNNDDSNNKGTQQQQQQQPDDTAGTIPTTRRRPTIIRANQSSSMKNNIRSSMNKKKFNSANDDDDDDDDTSYLENEQDITVPNRERSKTKSATTTKAKDKVPPNKKSTKSSKTSTENSRSSTTGSTGASWMDRNTQFMNTVGKVAPKNNPTTSTTTSASNSGSGNGSSTINSSTKRASVRSVDEGRNDATMTSSRFQRTNQETSWNKNEAPRSKNFDTNANDDVSRSFREDFRGTRVFVQGLPESTTWQVLKDHFRVAGNVVFASASMAIDPNTNRPKGHGIVQFETTSEARNAIRIMRDHPLHGNALYVREDVQDENSNKQLRTLSTIRASIDDDDDEDGSDATTATAGKVKGPTLPSKWKCADPEMAAQHLDPTTIQAVFQILKARNQARRRRNYEACDAMRDDLKNQYNVHIDDRLTMWWIGAAPSNVVDQVQGSGRWNDNENTNRVPPPTEWRQIMTTKENDACIDPDLIQGLLKQRDIARREKDFNTADALLEEARTAPMERHLTLRIHDESKTWRVWSDEAPFVMSQSTATTPARSGQWQDPQLNKESPPAEQCIALCIEYAPDKVDEVRQLLLKFPGREYNILKKLKQRYEINL